MTRTQLGILGRTAAWSDQCRPRGADLVASQMRERSGAGRTGFTKWNAVTIKKLCFLALISSALAAAASPAEEAYSRAIAEYEVCHYREAVAALRAAAEAGHVPAALMLATMLLVGQPLYGEQVPKDSVEGLHWLRQAASAGNEVARLQVARLVKGH